MGELPSIDMNQVDGILKRLSETNHDIVGAAIVSNEGFMLAGKIPKNIDEDLVSAVFTALRSIAQRASQQIELGNVTQLIMLSENGGALIHPGKRSSLILLMKPNANLGLILIDVMNVMREIKDFLE
ncbi:hypothetical protein DRO64_04370 [Candidatus Bathyarchaeota archaeon]|nr:MAG: hypothetical protein DRO47_02680 [Candidatus Bathyarchaeota archaeon]RLI44227.1 MAG: hypothetical protein DRO64_04370 [Candidatus Bathyarchaeota archaeon]HDM89520.1 hypothetical protein [Candidatus Bathyarchaeota archaeon]